MIPRSSSFCADRLGPRVELLVGEPHVEPGDDEGRHELAEPEQQADVDVAEHLGRHEVVANAPSSDVDRVPDQEERGHRKDEAAQPASQFLEFGTVLDVRCTAARARGSARLVRGRSVGDTVTPASTVSRLWPVSFLRPSSHRAALSTVIRPSRRARAVNGRSGATNGGAVSRRETRSTLMPSRSGTCMRAKTRAMSAGTAARVSLLTDDHGDERQRHADRGGIAGQHRGPAAE